MTELPHKERLPDASHIEQSRRAVELSRPEPTRAEQTRPEPIRAEQTRPEPTRAEQTRQEPTRAEQMRPMAETGT